MNTLLRSNGRMVLAALLVSAAACSDKSTEPAPNPNPQLSITFSDDQPFERDTVQATARVSNGNGGNEPPQALTWLVNDTTRAVIDAQGRLILRAPGAVQITARSGALQTTRTLTTQRLSVQKVTFTVAVVQLVQGDLSQMAVRLEGRGGRELPGREIAYTVDNPAVAQVDAAGRLRAVAPGITTVRASSEGATGTARVEVMPVGAAHELSRVDGTRVPILVQADSVEWDGVREYHEVWLEAGQFKVTSGTQAKYEIELNYVEYDIRQVDGRRQMIVRTRQREYDRGRVQYDTQGALRMTSDIVFPLDHTATSNAEGITVRYRIAGTNDILTLFYRPKL
ncbi:MAG: Ig-like domain-containing protein [Gemmatimonadaceae bacterium]|nr:Ig-like domain-containing protein [Gemmatimonadaceae bacterium]